MSKNKEKEKTDYEIIQEQFLRLQNLETKINYVNIVASYHECGTKIGTLPERVRYKSYKDVFDKMLSEEKYTILLIDDSMINMSYEFDKDKNLLKHTLSFMPNYKTDLLSIDEEEDEQKQDANISEEKYNMRLNNYIRIDFDEEGREEYYHSLVHMHIGLFKQNMRIPLQNIMFPNDFLFFVFKYIYHTVDEELVDLVAEPYKKCMLTEKEQKKLKLIYGVE